MPVDSGSAVADSKSTGDRDAWQIYLRLLRYAAPYKGMFALSILGMIAISSSEVWFVALLKPIMDGGFVEQDPEVLNAIPIWLVVMFLFRAIGQFTDIFCLQWVARSMIRDLRNEMFARTIRFSSAYYDQTATASLSSKLIYDIEQVANASTSTLRVLVKDSITTIALFGWMLYLSLKLTLVFVIFAPIVGVLVLYTSKKFRSLSKGIQDSVGEISLTAKEAFQGHKIVKSYSGFDYEIKRFKSVNASNWKKSIKNGLLLAGSLPIITLLGGVAMIAVISIIISGANTDEVTAGVFISYLGTILILMGPIQRLAKINQVLQTGVAAANSAFTLIDTPIEPDTGTETLAGVQGKIEFRQVSFTYNRKQRVLDDISFVVQPGERIAIVGTSGSGKSTIASLLLRLYQPESGAIYIDDLAIEKLRLTSLRNAIAIVTQDNILFDDTIRNNILYGSESTVDETRLHEAAKAAYVLHFTDKFPDGLDTLIGENGAKLSGGQKQRLALARAFYKKAPILLLDEATSSLDTESELIVQRATERLVKNCTTIVITHRLASIEAADRIIVIEDHRIAEVGNHSELLAKSGSYAQLYHNHLLMANSSTATRDDSTSNALRPD